MTDNQHRHSQHLNAQKKKMNKITTTLLAIALAASAGWAADPPEKKEVPLPPAVVNAENAALAAADKARSVYIKAVEAEVKKLQAALEKEKQAATKAGNLELAMAIKAKQEAMTVDAVVALIDERDAKNSDLLGGKTDDLVIISASYGAANKWVDVTEKLKGFSDGKTLTIKAGDFGMGDPAPQVRKEMRIEYTIRGMKKNITVNEGELINIGGK